MKKIPTLFERDWNGNRALVTHRINPVCQWVIDGEGIATRKLDGMCTSIIEGMFYKRREVLQGKPFPNDFVIIDQDKTTGKTIGWQPVGDGPEDQFLREARSSYDYPDGTYEFVGPKSQGNVEHYNTHLLIRHDSNLAFEGQVPRTYDELKKWMSSYDIEGIVWHHPDGRMSKLKLKDFGLKRIENVSTIRETPYGF